MSSLYLCSECSSSFASHEQLCQHTAEKHDVAVDVVEDEEADNCTEIDMKMEDDPISDTESTVSRSLKNPAGGYECEECHEMFTVKRESKK
ncbi:unnamed protein product [Caenorhabditis angaria]|uniref:C2H2-type domain-containing protein n=1 Tax=Caenorhabditis angaria TaxID=860376 RepID=A0A9P1IJW9_9PELO|nr:unnamed protein product [Caenorhabditis angaria]